MSISHEPHKLAKYSHEERVMHALRTRGPLSRGQIAAAVGLSRTTLSDITIDLLARGAIIVADTDAHCRLGGGRPAQLLAFDSSAGQLMGVDLGHARVRMAIVDASHAIIASGHATYSPHSEWAERLAITFTLIDRLIGKHGISLRRLQGIGVGVAGPQPAVRPDGSAAVGTVRDLVSTAFSQRFATMVVVDNNTRLAALAEATTGGCNSHHLMYLRLSDGVGGGLVVDGRLVTGGCGVAGEFGHVSVDPVGELCWCGKRGCLETVASTRAVLRACTERGRTLAALDDLSDALTRRDPVVIAVLEAAATAVGRVVAPIAVALDPDQIVVGGDLAHSAPMIVDRIHSIIAVELRSGDTDRPTVRAARLGCDDGALGAIAAVCQHSALPIDFSGCVVGR